MVELDDTVASFLFLLALCSLIPFSLLASGALSAAAAVPLLVVVEESVLLLAAPSVLCPLGPVMPVVVAVEISAGGVEVVLGADTDKD